ncbi:MAG: hypothetical protein KME59_14580 [Trichormus sp. ATA11-4-KO1]|jgi:hypothetical protein|nr:hypothetical protein [Trichormus sp. ATA11-4-KO1]
MYRILVQVVNECDNVIEEFSTHIARVPCVGEYISFYRVVAVTHCIFDENNTEEETVAEIKVA